MDGGCGHWPYRSWMAVGTCRRSLMVVGVVFGGIVERDGGREQKVRAKKVELVTSIMNLRSLFEFEMTLVYLPSPCTDLILATWNY